MHSFFSLLVLCVFLAFPLHAAGRHFTYTYETSVLPAGKVEIEPWTTWRVGRHEFYSRLDHRLEFEVGLTDRIQMAWYANFRDIADGAGGTLKHQFSWQGVSNEWKWKLMDPAADALGIALYGEWSLAANEFEIEGKLLLDKHIGKWIFASNLVVEPEWEFEIDETEFKLNFEGTLATAYAVNSSVHMGLELRNHNQWAPDEGFRYSALFLGPSFSYQQTSWWIAVTVLPQIAGLWSAFDSDLDHPLVLSQRERLEARVLLGFTL